MGHGLPCQLPGDAPAAIPSQSALCIPGSEAAFTAPHALETRRSRSQGSNLVQPVPQATTAPSPLITERLCFPGEADARQRPLHRAFSGSNGDPVTL